ncbi:MAG: hypothetical protein HOE71_04410 [Lentimicrobiaceae bacterium]|jgi:hypothetical protein|nr:hypothetical protein [Lentimicrobiaceae bacterium]MBT4061204.1 hypothetical protein [Lentimicrobiaceae bacterium]MBT4801548.1 hypothetical protein [Lentimicrobiaceae bacterium]MBT5163264.1 hypothetical protein [Lentimicrobiaceae bacterium]MBT5669140.1 hypothetical protein [Lentimicrobiaceae bacterium]
MGVMVDPVDGNMFNITSGALLFLLQENNNKEMVVNKVNIIITFFILRCLIYNVLDKYKNIFDHKHFNEYTEKEAV